MLIWLASNPASLKMCDSVFLPGTSKTRSFFPWQIHSFSFTALIKSSYPQLITRKYRRTGGPWFTWQMSSKISWTLILKTGSTTLTTSAAVSSCAGLKSKYETTPKPADTISSRELFSGTRTWSKPARNFLNWTQKIWKEKKVEGS